MATTDSRIGTTIAGYRIERLLGRGGMGRVYLAEDARLGRNVALKVLDPELATDERFRDRFTRESRLAASLDHPNVVPVYEAGEADGVLFIAMRHVEGTDLARLIETEGPLPHERTASLVSQVAAALDAAHEHGLIHRDVKPGNILVGKSDHTYLTDFGLIKRREQGTALTKTGQFMGSVDYAAPEQIEGKPVDGRADVYSLGCVLYECLTGEPPYPRDSEVAVMYAHLNDPVPKATAKRPELPAAVDDVVAQAMAKKPVDRYASARELAAVIRDTLTPTPAARPAAQRRTAFSVAVGGILVAALVATIFALTRSSGPPSTHASQTASPSVTAAASRPATVSRIDTRTNEVTTSVRDRYTGWHFIAAEGALWETGPNGLVKRDENTGKVLKVFHFGAQAHTVAAGFGAIWVTIVAGDSDHRVKRIDPATDKVVSTVDVSPTKTASFYILWVASDRRNVWVFDSGGTLWKIDPISNRVVGQFPITTAGQGAMTTGGGFVWVSDALRNEVVKVDPSTGKPVRRIPTTSEPDQLAYLDGKLLVQDTKSETITPIDTSTLQPGRPIAAPQSPAMEVAGLGWLWVAADGLVAEIDPVTGELHRITVGFPASTTAPDPNTGTVWVLRQPDQWCPPGC